MIIDPNFYKKLYAHVNISELPMDLKISGTLRKSGGWDQTGKNDDPAMLTFKLSTVAEVIEAAFSPG